MYLNSLVYVYFFLSMIEKAGDQLLLLKLGKRKYDMLKFEKRKRIL